MKELGVEKVVFSFNDTCELLAIKKSKLRSMIFQKEISPSFYLGRLIMFSKPDLQKFIKEKIKKQKENLRRKK